jgi:predicted O-linked N-acetylglucosamine transferase (SPINDLY family)
VRLAIARSWAGPPTDARRPPVATSPTDGRLRVGYLSSDFRNHPVSHQLLGVLRHHRRERFSVHAYSIGPDDGSVYRREIAACCDRFTDLTALTDAQAARRIAEDGVDILVDLNGHTAGNRMAIVARRPAAVQVNYLGFPGTTGSAYHDYLITDRTVTPEPHAAHFSEQFAYLPYCYMPTDDRQAVSPKAFRRPQFGLGEEQTVFCSFNSFWKIDRATFGAWASILKACPDACLWLPGGNEPAARNLRRAAEELGVSAERLVFAEKLPSKADHLARLALADLALDTFVYNGHVSTCDALWAGVPVLSLLGSQFAGRASASMLQNAGLPELVCTSVEAYQEKAVQLATGHSEVARLKAELKRNRGRHPLFDTKRITRDLERLYRAMAARQREGLPPGRIVIDAE